MKVLHINILDKKATYMHRDGDIVCGNSDYVIEFAFDAEWAAHNEKIARFVWNEAYKDVSFTGTTCPVPIITNATEVEVGVYAGELCTTTPALIGCQKSILCQSSIPGGIPFTKGEKGDPGVVAVIEVEDLDTLPEDVEDGTIAVIPNKGSGGGLPEITDEDKGKVLTANENGVAEWQEIDIPESLPEVVLTTPINRGATFTEEESAALSVAASTGKPVVVKCIVEDTPGFVMVMDNVAGLGLITLFLNTYLLLVNDGDRWVVLAENMGFLPDIDDSDDGRILTASSDGTAYWSDPPVFDTSDLEKRISDIESNHADNTNFVTHMKTLAENEQNDGKVYGIQGEQIVAMEIPSGGGYEDVQKVITLDDTVSEMIFGTLLQGDDGTTHLQEDGYAELLSPILAECDVAQPIIIQLSYDRLSVEMQSINKGYLRGVLSQVAFTGALYYRDVLTEFAVTFVVDGSYGCLSISKQTEPISLPKVSDEDNGKFLQVVDGSYALVAMKIYNGEVR